MRIIAGKHKGATLYLPLNKIIRPLKDRARESIFNLISHSNKIFFQLKDSHILDLYAGCGSFGLECLSRGADKVYFVEKTKDAAETLKKNIEKLKAKKNSNIFIENVFDLIIKKNIFKNKFDLIFCDPPFKDTNAAKLVQTIYYNNLLKDHGILILHRNKNIKEKFPDFFKIVDERIYGISKISFGKFLF